MAIKIIILLALGLVVWQLASALRALSRGGEGDPQRMLQALKMRVIWSIVIVAALFVLGALGVIDPHGL
ncbi:MAG: DUF2909 family protein [Pseudomonadota bacterium]